jgi:hypothetical protein
LYMTDGCPIMMNSSPPQFPCRNFAAFLF